MHFLISNDDGLSAPGIQVLSERIRQLGSVTIVAPDQNRSGASNSLTLDSPIRIREIDKHTFRVSGTPTDCVHIALTGLLDKDPDMVLSGINAGANLGDDVIYSGTVAAAMEGRFLGEGQFGGVGANPSDSQQRRCKTTRPYWQTVPRVV